MAYPIGSGSERLQRGTIHNMVNTDTAFRFDGGVTATGTSSYTVPAHHIITVLKIIICDTANAGNKWFQLIVTAGGVNMNLLYRTILSSKDTFVWNEKIVLHPTDKLLLGGDSGANFDVNYTYVDQDWS